jgi:DNA-3-methyladenine glycosylase
MFGPPGRAYVYLVYGMYDCLNVVTEPDGQAAAILIRAVEPLAGRDAMAAARTIHRPRRGAVVPASDRHLASGPGVLCAAFSIGRSLTGTDLLDPASALRIEPSRAPLAAARIGAGPRVGIDYAPEPWRSRPWRFVDLASGAVSRTTARAAART